MTVCHLCIALNMHKTFPLLSTKKHIDSGLPYSYIYIYIWVSIVCSVATSLISVSTIPFMISMYWQTLSFRWNVHKNKAHIEFSTGAFLIMLLLLTTAIVPPQPNGKSNQINQSIPLGYYIFVVNSISNCKSYGHTTHLRIIVKIVIVCRFLSILSLAGDVASVWL